MLTIINENKEIEVKTVEKDIPINFKYISIVMLLMIVGLLYQGHQVNLDLQATKVAYNTLSFKEMRLRKDYNDLQVQHFIISSKYDNALIKEATASEAFNNHITTPLKESINKGVAYVKTVF